MLVGISWHKVCRRGPWVFCFFNSMVPPTKKMKLCLVSYLLEDIRRPSRNMPELITTLQIAYSSVGMQKIFMLANHRQDHFRVPFFYEKWINQYLNYDFYSLFRMSRSTFGKLLCTVGRIEVKYFSKIAHTGGRPAVPLEKCLLICIWYLAKGETTISVADRFNITVSTVDAVNSKCIKYVGKLLPVYVKWPSEDERECVAEQFKELAGYPDVIGAIDGCHIPIKVRLEQTESYTNRKFFQSVILQAVCSAKRLLTNIFVGFPGSAHDARVCKNSALYQSVEQDGQNKLFGAGDGPQYHIIGDSAYPLKTWLMTPYEDRGRLTREQKNYNYKLSVTRVVIEQTFGILKARWRILKYINVNSIEKAIRIIVACCILHNFCLINDDEFRLDEKEQDSDCDIHPYSFHESDNEARRKRNNICNFLNT